MRSWILLPVLQKLVFCKKEKNSQLKFVENVRHHVCYILRQMPSLLEAMNAFFFWRKTPQNYAKMFIFLFFLFFCNKCCRCRIKEFLKYWWLWVKVVLCQRQIIITPRPLFVFSYFNCKANTLGYVKTLFFPVKFRVFFFFDKKTASLAEILE